MLMLFALLTVQQLFGQFAAVVEDPANLAINTATKALQEINNKTNEGQLDAINKFLKINEKWEKALTKVSSLISKNERIVSAFEHQKDIVYFYKIGLDNLKKIDPKNLNEAEIRYLREMYKILLTKTTSQVKDLYSIITPGYRMSDAERLTFIDKILKNLNDLKGAMRLLNKRVHYIENKRALDNRNKKFFSNGD